MKPPSSGSGAKNAAKSAQRTYRATSSCSSGKRPRTSIGPGTSAIPAETVGDVQRFVKHSAIPWMAATLDGIVAGTGAVFEAKFMLPWYFSEEAAVEKYMAQLQHNMWVTHLKTAVLSIITGGGKWVEITVPIDPLYLSILVSAEKKFWRCVQSGEVPHLINAEPPRPRIEAIRIVDMSSSNSWAEFAALFRNTRAAFLDQSGQRPSLKASFRRTRRRQSGMGYEQSARSQAP